MSKIASFIQNKKGIFFILLILVIIITILSLSFKKEEDAINYEVDTINLTIYGSSAEPINYSTKDKFSIISLVKKINSNIKSDNKIINEEELDIPNGVSYKLEFVGSKSSELDLIHGYCIFNDEAYKIENYESFMNDIKNCFDIK